jgi:hypothetical protein
MLTTSSGTADRIVVGSLFAVGVLDTVAAFSGGHKPTLREGLGLAVAGVLLAAMAGPAPELAAGFSLLLLISSLYTVGASTFALLGKALD